MISYKKARIDEEEQNLIDERSYSLYFLLQNRSSMVFIINPIVSIWPKWVVAENDPTAICKKTKMQELKLSPVQLVVSTRCCPRQGRRLVGSGRGQLQFLETSCNGYVGTQVAKARSRPRVMCWLRLSRGARDPFFCAIGNIYLRIKWTRSVIGPSNC